MSTLCLFILIYASQKGTNYWSSGKDQNIRRNYKNKFGKLRSTNKKKPKHLCPEKYFQYSLPHEIFDLLIKQPSNSPWNRAAGRVCHCAANRLLAWEFRQRWPPA